MFTGVFILVISFLYADNGKEARISLEVAQKTYPAIFENVPAELRPALYKRLEQEYSEWHSFKKSVVRTGVDIQDENAKKMIMYTQHSFKEFLDKLLTDEKLLSKFIIQTIVAQLVVEFDLDTTNRSRYYFLRDYQRYKGKRIHADFRDFKKRSIQKEQATWKNNLVQQYKIHLMPKLVDLYPILKKFFTELRTNPELQAVINDVKIMDTMAQEYLAREPFKIAARVVIYPASGKENTQKALDLLYALFKETKGVDVTPRFNEKITSLIFVAQGDADDKLDLLKNKYEQFKAGDVFEIPDMIYYKKDFTGQVQDYYLQKPKNGEKS